MPSAVRTSESGKLPEIPYGLVFREAAPLLARLIKDRTFLDERVLPFLERPARDESWRVVYRHDALDGSCSLQIFLWPPGSTTRIHDHSSWGVFCCAIGILLEERYQRLDDSSRPGHARLKLRWRRAWRIEDGVSTVLPYDEGIHRVGNPSDRTAISVHL